MFTSRWSDGFPWWLLITQYLRIPEPFDLVTLNLQCVVCEMAKREDKIVDSLAGDGGGAVGHWPGVSFRNVGRGRK